MRERLKILERRMKMTKRIIPKYIESGDKDIAQKLRKNLKALMKEIAILREELINL